MSPTHNLSGFITLDVILDGEAEYGELAREIAAKLFEINNVTGCDIEFDDVPAFTAQGSTNQGTP